MIQKLVASILILALVSGCASFFAPEAEKTAAELMAEGTAEFEDGDYLDAIKAFQKLKDWYPFSKYAIQAELKIADAHYNLKQYEEAIIAYESFEKLHPRNEAVPRVVYRIGRCYFDRIDTIDRDRITVEKAMDTFKRLRDRFPGNEFSEKAVEHIRACRKNLAEREFYVGRFYLKSDHYKAALHRFEIVRDEYSDVQIGEDITKYIKKCERLIAKGESAE